ncbi:MAG TPA: CoA ester lyase [Solirubrobacteraceae bacterium]|jgi:citrate lyase subunit beta/citryl-CoA lyase|nr:CoA ester lyase [Solirubrobacteraceae bacterium]
MRSLLFAPATRPELVAKLPRSGPDAVAIDLEDAVPEAGKAQARPLARAGAAELLAGTAAIKVFVRVNGPATEHFDQDVAEAVPPGAGIVVPKLESSEQLGRVRVALAAAGLHDAPLIAGIETARGVHGVDALLGPPAVACYFGAEDFIADIGGRRTPGSAEVAYARARVVLSARVSGVCALDQAVLALDDEAAFLADAKRGRDLGYGGKICIHPSQVALAHRVFTPSQAEQKRARRLIATWEAAAEDTGAGVAVFEGAMIDEPALKAARAVLERAR